MPPARQIDFGTLTAGTVLIGGPFILMGWAFKETTGSAQASCDLYSGSNNTGILTAPVTLNANESTREALFPHGLEMNGAYLAVNSGSVRVVLWVVMQ